jgi:uncharacterized protein (DUF4415 family)
MKTKPFTTAIFKATGENWQTKMNDVLREWVKSHPDLITQ